ncbi:DNA-directed RNA polymerase subunit beta [Orchesella cincta]|uniref:DNA-directed RNA polymerase subunit beta n=1 Tax=Orchesella cincta TaxID=48709 RepID=A0A1D2M7I6_ORCCI|nr:DNA-directed RNA polymerase subunit beta [Orchesella cincta]
MIGAFKGCGGRLIRGVQVLTLEQCSVHCGLGFNIGDYPFGGVNWSQKRFLRGQPPSGPEISEGSGVSDQKQQEGTSIECASQDTEDKPQSLSNCVPIRKYCRSVRGHQTHLISSLPSSEDAQLEDLIGEISKLIVESAPASVRVKNRKHEELLTEWIGVQKEIRTVKQDRVEDDRKKLQIAGQQVLREMARLTKSINLDDLDQAIEGALCSQAKSDYGQQKWRDN